MGSRHQAKLPPWKWGALHPWSAAVLAAALAALLILLLVLTGMATSNALRLSVVVVPIVFVLVGAHNSLRFREYRRSISQ